MNWDEQRRAIEKMASLLKPCGDLLLVENTQEGLAALNGLRAGLDLPPIAVRWHNFYIPQLEFEAWAEREFEVLARENIGNLYYIISRVVYAKLAQIEGVEPEYMHPINEIAASLPALADHAYSPNFLFKLRPRYVEQELSAAALDKIDREISEA